MKPGWTGIMEKISGFLRVRLKLGGFQAVITLSFTAVTILSLIFVSIMLYGTFSENAEKNAAASTQQIMDQANLNLENYLKGMMEISDLVSASLTSDPQKDGSDLRSLFSVTSRIRKDIVTMTIYTNKGNVVNSAPGGAYDRNFRPADQDWFGRALEKPEQYIFIPPHVQRMLAGKRPWVVSLCRGIASHDNSAFISRVTEVDMNFSTIEQVCSKVSLGKRGYIYIVDASGDIIYHPQQQIIYAGLKQENIYEALDKEPGSYFDSFTGEKRIMTVKNINYTGWKMVGISYVDELVPNKRNLNYFVYFISLFGIAFEIAASLFISNRISKPIKRLENQMKRVENGDFDIYVEVKGEDEVRHLSEAFNLMVARIRQLMQQIISEQESIRKSELKALQAQINPHFLYNTLDSIVWMNENGKYEGVTTMVSALARLFRVSISKGNEIIDISDELEHARSYLVIQKIRYKDKFDFSIEAEPEVLGRKTLKLILQPIIENAIYHGIHQLNEKGEIRISASVRGGEILFTVSDNGYGIKPEFLKGVLDREPKSLPGPGVGLKNVNERIKLYFGKEYGINISSELDVGTTVFIRIPADAAAEGGANEDAV